MDSSYHGPPYSSVSLGCPFTISFNPFVSSNYPPLALVNLFLKDTALLSLRFNCYFLRMFSFVYNQNFGKKSVFLDFI
jgi:hypothetical protein